MNFDDIKGYQIGVHNAAQACMLLVERPFPGWGRTVFRDTIPERNKALFFVSSFIEFIPIWPNLTDSIRIALDPNDARVLQNLRKAYLAADSTFTINSRIVGCSGWVDNDFHEIPDPDNMVPGGITRVDARQGHAVCNLGEFTRGLLEQYKYVAFGMRNECRYVPPVPTVERLLREDFGGHILEWLSPRGEKFVTKWNILGIFYNVDPINMDKRPRRPAGVLSLRDTLDVVVDGVVETLKAADLVCALRKLHIEDRSLFEAFGFDHAYLYTSDEIAGRVSDRTSFELPSYIVRNNAHSWATIRNDRCRPVLCSDMSSIENIMTYLRGFALTYFHEEGQFELVVPIELNLATIRHSLKQTTKAYLMAV